jgi:transcription antitermination factor NusG
MHRAGSRRWNLPAVREQCRNHSLFKTETTSRWGGARPNSGPKPVVYFARPQDLQWYCVRTQWGEDRTAAIEIGMAGFDSFAPTMLKPAVRARRLVSGQIRPARPARIEPLFLRYQFARFRRSDDWQRIRELPGVEGILGPAPDMPSAVSDAAIDVIRGMCSANGCLYPAGELPSSMVGTQVRMLEGPMISFEGMCDWSDGERVRVLLSLFGRPCPVTVLREAVEAI